MTLSRERPGKLSGDYPAIPMYLASRLEVVSGVFSTLLPTSFDDMVVDSTPEYTAFSTTRDV